MLTLKTLATAVILTVADPTIALQATAATAAEQSVAQSFVKKSKSIKGSYTLRTAKTRFGAAFNLAP